MIKIVVYADEYEKKRLGAFYIHDEVSKQWLERNVPPLIHVAQLLAGIDVPKWEER